MHLSDVAMSRGHSNGPDSSNNDTEITMRGDGELLKSYFVPNGSYLMELAEDGSNASQVQVLQAIGKAIERDLKADAIIVASPHWLPKRAFFVDSGGIHESFHDYVLRPAPFGRRFYTHVLPGDPDLARAMVAAGQAEGLPVEEKTYGMDHGAFCPLKVMGTKIPVVPISVSQRSFGECIRWGKAIRKAVEASGKRAVLIAPGNLTHRLDLRVEQANGQYFEDGKEFDRQVVDLVSTGRSRDIEFIDRRLWEAAAPEAGLRPFFLIAGASGDAAGQLLQYEGAIYSVGDASFAFDTVSV
jgi:aromatic ring-opening dioxygenase catalytic subunit (LigB family)